MTGAGWTIRPFQQGQRHEVVGAAIEEVFFGTSATPSFPDDAARAAFRERWLGRYLERWPQWCFFAETDAGGVAGYLAGCCDNPATSTDFADHGYYALFDEECRRFPAHLHINVLPEHRGAGVGTDMIAAFAAKCAAQDLPGFHAITADGHRNNAFFERCGLRAEAHGSWNNCSLVLFGRAL